MKIIDTEYAYYSCEINDKEDLIFRRYGKETARIPKASLLRFANVVEDSYYFHMGKTRGRWFKTHDNISCDYKERERGCVDVCIVIEWIRDAMYLKVHSSIYEQVSTNTIYEVSSGIGFRKLLFGLESYLNSKYNYSEKENNNMKNVWEIIVIDKKTDLIIAREIVIDGDEKSACSKVSIQFADKLKNLVFDNLVYIAKSIGSY